MKETKRYPDIREKLAMYFNIVKEEERKPKSERRNDLSKIKVRVATLTRWLKELQQ